MHNVVDVREREKIINMYVSLIKFGRFRPISTFTTTERNSLERIFKENLLVLVSYYKLTGDINAIAKLRNKSLIIEEWSRGK